MLRTDAGRAAVALEPDERFVGLLYLGRAVQTADAPSRDPVIPGGREDIRERSALVAMHLLRTLLGDHDAPL